MQWPDQLHPFWQVELELELGKTLVESVVAVLPPLVPDPPQ
jgi:hypothetical protein